MIDKTLRHTPVSVFIAICVAFALAMTGIGFALALGDDVGEAGTGSEDVAGIECPACGTWNDDWDIFCVSCGAELHGAAPEEPGPEPEPEPDDPIVEENTYTVSYYLNSIDEQNLLGTESGVYEGNSPTSYDPEKYMPDGYSAYILDENGVLRREYRYKDGLNTFSVVYLPGSYKDIGDYVPNFVWYVTLDYNGYEEVVESPGGSYTSTGTWAWAKINNDLEPQPLAFSRNAPDYEGHTFLGWFDDPVGGNEVDLETALFRSNTTLYAHWAEDSSKVSIGFNIGFKASGIQSTGFKDYKEAFAALGK